MVIILYLISAINIKLYLAIDYRYLKCKPHFMDSMTKPILDQITESA